MLATQLDTFKQQKIDPWLLLLLHPILWTLCNVGYFLAQAISFWPIFYYHLIMDPNGRSILDILRNPSPQVEDIPKHEVQRSCSKTHFCSHSYSRRDRRHMLEKGKVPIRGYCQRSYILSAYSLDNYNYNFVNGGSEYTVTMMESMAFTHYFASTFNSVAKTFEMTLPREPLDGILSETIFRALIAAFIFYHITLKGLFRIFYLPRHKTLLPLKRRWKHSQESIMPKKACRQEYLQSTAGVIEIDDDLFFDLQD